MGHKNSPHTLDLHGIRHADVEEKVKNFILLNQDQMPLEIIYGNSVAMYHILTKCLNQIGVTYSSGYQNQYGRLLALRWKK